MPTAHDGVGCCTALFRVGISGNPNSACRARPRSVHRQDCLHLSQPPSSWVGWASWPTNIQSSLWYLGRHALLGMHYLQPIQAMVWCNHGIGGKLARSQTGWARTICLAWLCSTLKASASCCRRRSTVCISSRRRLGRESTICMASSTGRSITPAKPFSRSPSTSDSCASSVGCAATMQHTVLCCSGPRPRACTSSNTQQPSATTPSLAPSFERNMWAGDPGSASGNFIKNCVTALTMICRFCALCTASAVVCSRAGVWLSHSSAAAGHCCRKARLDKKELWGGGEKQTPSHGC